MKKLFLFFCLQLAITGFAADLSVKQSGARYTMKNKYLQVMVNADSGGRIEKMTDLQTGNELTVMKSVGVSPQGSGLAGERFSRNRNFEKSAYKVSVAKANSQSAELCLSAVSNGIKIEKTFILTKDKASLLVKYAISNLSDSKITGTFWGVNVIYPGKKPELLKIYLPYGIYNNDFSKYGVKQKTVLNYIPGKNPVDPNNLVNEPVSSWAAVLDQNGIGAVVDVDFARLDRFYSFLSLVDGFQVPTVEWFTRRLVLKPLAEGIKDAANRPELDDPLQDYIYKTSCSYMPIAGFPEVSAFNNGIAVGIEAKGKNAVVSLCADRALAGAALQLQVTGPDKKLFSPVQSSKLDLQPGKPIQVKLAVPGLDISNKLLLVKIMQDSGPNIASMSVPYFDKAFEGKFTVAAQGKKDTSFAPKETTSEFGTDYKVPMIDWGKKLNRKLKVLALYGHLAHREIAELDRRFNLDLSPVEYNIPHVFNFSRPAFVPWSVPDPAVLLEKNLKKKYDAILICGGLYWKQIPAKSRKNIIKAIENGTGLIYVNPHYSQSLKKLVSGVESSFMDRGIPVRFTPGLGRNRDLRQIAETGRLGKGNVVLLNYNTAPNGKLWRTGPRAITAAIDNDVNVKIPYWEYYYSLIGRALRFSSGDQPQIQISSASLKDVTINNKGTAAKVDMTIDIFNKEWKKVDSITKKVELDKGTNKVSLTVPAEKLGMNGEYYVNVFLNSNGRRCDWFSFVEAVNHGYGIDKLNLQNKTFPEIAEISGSCTLKGELKGQLQIRVTDIYDRVIAEQIVKADKRDISFALKPLIAPLSILCKIRAELRADKEVLDFSEDFLTVNIPRIRDVKFIVWGATEALHWTKGFELDQMKRMGFDWCTGVQMNSFKENESDAAAWNVLNSGMEFMPMGIHGIRVKHQYLKDKIRKPCLRDPEYFKEMSADIVRFVDWTKRFFPPYYFVGDENSLGSYSKEHDFCFGPCCLTKFRIWLQKYYSSINELNSEWQTNFKNWDAVIPETMSEAEKSGQWARWMDHRRFMFEALGETIAKQHDVLVKADPYTGGLAVSGMGTPLIHNGFDWSDLEKNLNLVVAYIRESGRVMDPMRSFLRPGDLLSAWNGYDHSAEFTDWRNWHEVINSFFVPSFWWGNRLVNHGDASFSIQGAAMRKIIEDIRASGIGKLLIESKRENSEIAVLYSTASLIATGKSGMQGINNTIFNGNLDGWSGILRDAGFQPPDYFSREDLIQNGLDPQKTKVFILPLSQALGDKEIAVLVDYVRAGGILVADAVPGTCKLNGNSRENNPLFKVFGCEFKNKNVGKSNKNISLPGTHVLPLTAASEFVTLSGAKAAGSTATTAKTINFGGMKIRSGGKSRNIPVLLSHKYGKGRAIYLNSLLSDYEGFRIKQNQSRKVVNAIVDLLRRNGAKVPAVTLPAGSELIRFSLGDMRIFAMNRIVRAQSDDLKFSVKLDKPGYVYDLRQKKLLGKSNVLSGDLSPGKTRVFAVLSKPLAGIKLSAGKTETGIAFDVSLATPDSIVRTSLTAPDGASHEHYTRNWLVKGTRRKATIDLGINECHGKWKLTVQDIISGKSEKRIINFD